MKAIINTNIIFPDHMILDGTILIDGDKIVDYGKNIEIGDAEVIDAQGLYTGPGLIDIHTHSDARAWFYDDPEGAANTVLNAGVTTVLPTLYFSQPGPELIREAKVIRDAVDAGKCPNILGFYMEAPYMNPKYGADRENNPWNKDIDRNDYMPLLEAFGDFVRVWGIAPERENIEMFAEDALKVNPNVVFSVAHSEADPYQVAKMMPYGLKLATHHTNATGTLNKYPECRGVCVDEAVNYNKEIYAELICDRIGAHVVPYMQRLVRRVKGDDRIILISDQFVDDGPVPEGFEEATDINFDHAGEIAGSAMTLDLACRNVLFHMGCSVCDSFRFASTNPARALGLWDRGAIAVGNVADLVFVDQFFDIKKVIFKGETV